MENRPVRSTNDPRPPIQNKGRGKPRRRGKKEKKHQQRHHTMQALALERISDLFCRAQAIAPAEPALADRYIQIARKIAMGAKVFIPQTLKRQVCHGCKRFLVPGQSMRFRIHSRPRFGKFLSVTCLHCGHITRYLAKPPKTTRLPPSRAPPIPQLPGDP